MYFDSLGLNYRALHVIRKFTIRNGGNCPVERIQYKQQNGSGEKDFQIDEKMFITFSPFVLLPMLLTQKRVSLLPGILLEIGRAIGIFLEHCNVVMIMHFFAITYYHIALFNSCQIIKWVFLCLYLRIIEKLGFFFAYSHAVGRWKQLSYNKMNFVAISLSQ